MIEAENLYWQIWNFTMIPKETPYDNGNAYFDFKYHLSMGYNSKMDIHVYLGSFLISLIVYFIPRVCASILKLTL